MSTAWGPSLPGLLALPGGTLEAIFGAISPALPSQDGLWGITSSDGGATWSAPMAVGSGILEAQAYNASITAKLSGTTPVLTLPESGNLVIQQGLGLDSPTYQASNATDGEATDPDMGADAGTGAVVVIRRSHRP